MKVLNNKWDFEWYKKELDLRRKYTHNHEGTPTEYPCKVISRLDNVSDYSSSFGATDIYYHDFLYQEEQVCKECDHKQLIWPSKQIDEIVDN